MGVINNNIPLPKPNIPLALTSRGNGGTSVRLREVEKSRFEGGGGRNPNFQPPLT